MGHFLLGILLLGIGMYFFYDRSELEQLWVPPTPGTREYEQFKRDPPHTVVLAKFLPEIFFLLSLIGASLYAGSDLNELLETDINEALVGFGLLALAVKLHLKERLLKRLHRTRLNLPEKEDPPC